MCALNKQLPGTHCVPATVPGPAHSRVGSSAGSWNHEDLLFYHLPIFTAPSSASVLQSSNWYHQFEDMTLSYLIITSIRILTMCILLSIMSAWEAEENFAQVASCTPWKALHIDLSVSSEQQACLYFLSDGHMDSSLLGRTQAWRLELTGAFPT